MPPVCVATPPLIVHPVPFVQSVSVSKVPLITNSLPVGVPTGAYSEGFWFDWRVTLSY